MVARAGRALVASRRGSGSVLSTRCAASGFGRNSLSHFASALVEIEGPRSRREEDQLQDVAGRFKIQNSGVVRAELIGIVFSGHHRNCIGHWPV